MKHSGSIEAFFVELHDLDTSEAVYAKVPQSSCTSSEEMIATCVGNRVGRRMNRAIETQLPETLPLDVAELVSILG